MKANMLYYLYFTLYAWTINADGIGYSLRVVVILSGFHFLLDGVWKLVPVRRNQRSSADMNVQPQLYESLQYLNCEGNIRVYAFQHVCNM